MPTQRFLNLPEEKRRRVTQAALHEVARVPFDEISINKIVQEAGIPRGSFYQYFEDKKDLLDYLMEGYRTQLTDNIRRWLAEGNGDLFHVFRRVFDFTIAFGASEQNREICRNLFTRLQFSQGASFDVLQIDLDEVIAALMPKLDLSRLRHPAPEDVRDLTEILILLMRRAAAAAFSDPGTLEAARARFERELNLLCEGALLPQ